MVEHARPAALSQPVVASELVWAGLGALTLLWHLMLLIASCCAFSTADTISCCATAAGAACLR